MSAGTTDKVVGAAGADDNGTGGVTVPGGAVEKKKKGPKKGTKRNKPSKLDYEVAEGKLQSSETPGFDITKHKKLVSTSFADPLDFAKWQVWYFEQMLAKAQNEVEEMRGMGDTAEARAAAREMARILKSMENFVAAQVAAGSKLSSGLQERLGALYGKASTT